MPQLSTSNPVKKLEQSLFLSMRRIVPQCTWYFTNDSICWCMTPGIAVFIDAVFLVVQQLSTIGHRPNDLEISDKLLIRLHQLWTPIHTTLTLCEKTEKPELKKITSALKQFKVNESLVAVCEPLVKVEQPELSLAELALYMKSQGGGSKKGHGRKLEEFDWGNMKDCEGVCWRCGEELYHQHAWGCQTESHQSCQF